MSAGSRSDLVALLGRSLGKYTLLRLLGTGGNGAVFLAREVDPKLAIPRLVAVKTFRETDDAIGHLFDEARIAIMLDHPNIVRLHEFGEIDGLWFFGMDFVAGETLSDLIRKVGELAAPESWAWPASIIASACRGLQHAHENGIIHRDIKPANLMVRYDGNVTIMDFGIAKAASFSNIHTAAFRGTPAYMSPEQVASRPVDARSDLFSLGVVLYELCTGARLFQRADLAAIVYAITQDEIPPPRSRAPDLPKELEDIIMHMLARKREERFASAAEVERALREILVRERFADYDGPRYMRALFGERLDHTARIAELAKTADPCDPRLLEPRPKLSPAPPAHAESTRDGGVLSILQSEPIAAIDPTPLAVAPLSSAFDAGTTINHETWKKQLEPGTKRSSRTFAVIATGSVVVAAAVVSIRFFTANDPPPVIVPPVQSTRSTAPVAESTALDEKAPMATVPRAERVESPVLARPKSDETEKPKAKARKKPAPPERAAGEPGWLNVTVLCNGERTTAMVSIDGKTEEQTPVRMLVSPGLHRVSTKGASGEESKTVTVTSGMQSSVPLEACAGSTR